MLLFSCEVTHSLFLQTSLDSFAQYLESERRAKQPDQFVIIGIYERAITEAAQRRFAGEAGAEEALRIFWIGYLDFLVSSRHD